MRLLPVFQFMFFNIVHWEISASCFALMMGKIQQDSFIIYQFYFSSSKDYKIKIYLENQHNRYNRCRGTATKWLVGVLVKGKCNIFETYISDYSSPPSISVVRRMHSGKE